MFNILQNDINGKFFSMMGWDDDIVYIKEDGFVYRYTDGMKLGLFCGFATTVEEAFILEHNLEKIVNEK